MERSLGECPSPKTYLRKGRQSIPTAWPSSRLCPCCQSSPVLPLPPAWPGQLVKCVLKVRGERQAALHGTSHFWHVVSGTNAPPSKLKA
eukprot:3131740-Amphidinium_carterae.1